MSSGLVSRAPVEIEIAFWQLHPLPSPNGTLTHARPVHGTVAWHYNYSPWDRTIKLIQLHRRALWQPPSVVLVTNDGSIFELQLHPHAEHHQLPTRIRVTRIPDPKILAATLWISIEIAQELDTGINLQFILSVCCGASTFLDHTKSDHKAIFALVLAHSVARRCLKDHIHFIGSTGSVLDEFWRDVSSLPEVVGQSFWEADIAIRRRKEVGKWIFNAARDYIISSLQLQSPEPRGSQPMERKRQIIAASIVAWLEFSASKQESASLAQWDSAWNRTWDANWNQNWEDSWSLPNSSQALSTTLGGLYHFSELIPLTGATIVDGKLAGKNAGRATMETTVVATTAVKIPSGSLLESEITAKLVHPRVGNPTERSAAHNAGVSRENQNPNWLELWRSHRHPGSNLKWLPVREAASNTAWAISWEKAVEAGRKSVESVSGARPEPPTLTLQPVTSHEELPNPTIMQRQETSNELLSATAARNMQSSETVGSRKSTSSRIPVLDLQRLIQGFTTTLNAGPKNKAPTFDRGIAQPKTGELSEAAWQEAHNDPSGAENKAALKTRANKFLELAKKDGNLAAHVIELVSSKPRDVSGLTIWEEVFISTWHKTWTQSWESAWLAVMNDTADKLWHRGFLEGRLIASLEGERTEDAARILNPPETVGESYSKVKAHISSGGSSGECYWHIRSMFKALDMLYEALVHSVPTLHHGKLTIKRYADRTKPIVNSARNLKEAAKQNLEDFDILTHAGFQEETIKLIRDRAFKNEKESDHLIALMGKVWNKATEADHDPDFMSGKDPEMNESCTSKGESQLPNNKKKNPIHGKWLKLVDAVMKQKNTVRKQSLLAPTGTSQSAKPSAPAATAQQVAPPI